MKTRHVIYGLIVGLFIVLLSVCNNQEKHDLLKYQQAEVNSVKNVEIVTKSFEILDDLDLKAYELLLEPDHKVFMGSSKEPLKFSEITPFIRTVYESFPDYKHDVNNIIATEDYVVAQVQLSGTHTNVYHEVEPTGNRIDYSGVFIFNMVNGKISEIWVLEDNLTRDSQLGFPL